MLEDEKRDRIVTIEVRMRDKSSSVDHFLLKKAFFIKFIHFQQYFEKQAILGLIFDSFQLNIDKGNRDVTIAVRMRCKSSSYDHPFLRKTYQI